MFRRVARQRRREPARRADRGRRRRRPGDRRGRGATTATACSGSRSRASAPRSPPACGRATRRPTSWSCSTPTRCGRRARCARCCGRSPTRASAASRRGRRSSTPAHEPRAPARGLDGGHPLPPHGARRSRCSARSAAWRAARSPTGATAFEPAVERLVRQTVFGVPQHVGDDRVLTNELLRSGWRTVYQSTALVRDRRAVGLARRSGASSCAGAARASARRC